MYSLKTPERQRDSLVAQSVKNMPINAGDSGLSPWWGRSPREGNGNPFQHSCLGNPMDRSLVGYIQSMGSQESDATYRLNRHHSPSPPPLPRLGLRQLSHSTPSAGPGTEYRPPGLRLVWWSLLCSVPSQNPGASSCVCSLIIAFSPCTPFPGIFRTKFLLPLCLQQKRIRQFSSVQSFSHV